MRKSISVILAVVMLIAMIYPCQNLIVNEIERKNVISFCNQIIAFNKKYDVLSNDSADTMPNRLIVKTNQRLQNTNAVDSVYGLDYEILQFDSREAMEKEYNTLLSSGYTVEQDIELSVASVDNDDDTSSSLWSYESAGVNYSLSKVESDEEIIVGVLDTGADYTHESLVGRICDTTLNFSTSGDKNDSMDDQGHGTSVASIIAMSTPNNVKIKPYKVLNSNGGSSVSEFVSAVEYILNEKDKPDILNMSFTGYNFVRDDSIEVELISQLVESGIVVCVSAGNDNLPITYCTPARCTTAITVGAYDSDYNICAFSNYGDDVDISAPGSNIYTADLWSGGYSNEFSGTSGACAFVSSACAYVLLQNPSFAPKQVKDKILSTAINMSDDDAIYFGSGILSVSNLLDDKIYDTLTPSVLSGSYTNSLSVEFNDIPDNTQLVYTLDKSIPSASNGIVYSQPILIDNEAQLNYALIQNDTYVSNISSQYYKIECVANESDFEINSTGEIISYNGSGNNIIVPDVINSITVTAIGKNVFENSDIVSITLPNTVTKIGSNCFSGCKSLKHIVAKGVTVLNTFAFQNCSNLRDEVMPNLSTAGAYSFYGCTMLHNVDFSESISLIFSYAFSLSGLIDVDFPNATNVENASQIFSNSTIVSCNLPKFNVIGSYMFANCVYLKNAYLPNATEIYDFVFSKCKYLNEFDATNILTIYSKALANCYIDTFNAPNCTQILDSSYSGLDVECYVRVLYLPNLKSINENTFSNMSLDSLEILWLPKAENIVDTTIDAPSLKLLYAVNMTSLSLSNVKNASVVISDKMESFDVETIDTLDNLVLIAPDNSISTFEEQVNNENIKLVDTNDVNFIGIDDANLLYDNGYSQISIPFSFVADCWSDDLINKSRYNQAYQFIFDFNNDSIINAKDYSILYKMS